MAVAAGLLIATALLVFLRLTPYHPWGDDFAGYLLQARGLQEGRARAEMELNRSLQDASDWRTGPDAYPWGVPAVLAGTARVVGWDVNRLKIVGVVGIATLAGLLIRLGYQLGFSPLGTAAFVAAVLWQPSVIGEADLITSDLLFLVFCTIHLNVLVPAMRRLGEPGHRSTALLLAAGAVALLSFGIRSTGIVLIGVTLLLLMVRLLYQQNRSWARKATWVGIALAAAAAMLAIYVALVPDGTLIYYLFLNFELDSVLMRATEIAQELPLFLPIALMPDAIDHFVPVAVALVAAIGAMSTGPVGFALGLTVAAHLGVLLVFPNGDGLRYYYPAVPAAVALFFCGLARIVVWARSRWGIAATTASRLSAVAQGALILVMLIATPLRPSFNGEIVERGPLSSEFRDLAAAVRRLVPEHARVSFFRPRAFRWFTDRPAIMLVDPTHLDRVDAVVIYHRLEAVDESVKQPSEAAVVQRGDFALEYRNSEFSLYIRKGPAVAGGHS